jgi:hypothetical protein
MYNLSRHMKVVHNMYPEQPPPNVDDDPQNVEQLPQNVEQLPQNVERLPQNVERPHKCTTCYKAFARKDSLKRHMQHCKNTPTPNVCTMCEESFPSRSALSHHKKKCDGTPKKQDLATATGTQDLTSPTSSSHSNSIVGSQVQAHTVNVGSTVNYILNFPEHMSDEKFAYVKDHITQNRLEQLFHRNIKPKQGFARYTHAVLERPENRNAYKTSPNNKYTRIWKDGRWVYELDEDVYNLLVYHMSLAALEDIHNYKEANRKMKIDFQAVAQCLDDINTENDENDNHSYALEKLKVSVLNFSERFRLPKDV